MGNGKIAVTVKWPFTVLTRILKLAVNYQQEHIRINAGLSPLVLSFPFVSVQSDKKNCLIC